MKRIQADRAAAAVGPYVHGMISGNLLFTSGQIGLDLQGRIVEGGLEAQTEQMFQNLEAILEEAGSSLDRVVKTLCFLKNMDDFARFNELYEKRFGSHKPARSCIEAARLPKGALVEVEVIAEIG